MDLELADDLVELRASIAPLAAKYRSADGSCDNSASFWDGFAAAGWPALALPEDRGGADGTLAACGVVLEEIARNGLVTPFLSSLVVGGRFLARIAPAQAYQDVFTGLIEGQARLALVGDLEEAGDAQDRPADQTGAVTARKHEDGWHFDGTIEHVIGGGGATHVIVIGSREDAAPVVAVLPVDYPGLALRRFPTWRGEDAADVAVNCAVPGAQVIGGRADSAATIAQTLREARVASCWEALGMIRGLLDDTVEHVRTRIQFGAAMANLQAVRHRIAEMSVYLRESQILVQGATLQVAGPQGERTALAARARVAEAARYVGRQAVQLHGAMGTTQESRVAALFRRLTAFDQLYGSTSSILLRYADCLIGADAVRTSAILPQ